MIYIIIAIIAYCIGSISFSVIIGRKMSGKDVRTEGSKNAGSTNVLRVAGKKAAVLTLIGDIFKGIIAVMIAYICSKIFPNINGALLVQIAAVAVILGHTFPVFFQFKGGKGIATSLGVLLVLNYQIGLICLILALILIIITRMVSVGSLAAGILFPILTIFMTTGYLIPGNYIIFAIIIALLVLYNHRTNIQRLVKGTENKISLK